MQVKTAPAAIKILQIRETVRGDPYVFLERFHLPRVSVAGLRVMSRWERTTLFLVHLTCYLVQSNFIVFLDERVMDMGIPRL